MVALGGRPSDSDKMKSRSESSLPEEAKVNDQSDQRAHMVSASEYTQMQRRYVEEQRRIQQAAQHTIKTLKKILRQKSATIKRYQDRLEALSAERLQEREEMQDQLSKVSDRLYTENRDT